jgi:proteasome lid subunit RPN8/RPN11
MTSKTSNRPLLLTPYAWAKLLFLRDLGSTEVGGFGISSQDDLLLIENICLIQQLCTEVTVRFDDQAVADFFDQQVDAGRPPERFARIWVHTHPGKSPQPSNTDEETFGRCFGGSDWAVMFILARGGQTYARLRLNAGPGGDLVLPVEVDFSQPFPAAAQAAWEQEYDQAVRLEQLMTWEPRPERRLSFARSLVECGDRGRSDDPYLEDSFWDDQPFNSFMEGLHDRDRDPF